jgi:hypothetical protein
MNRLTSLSLRSTARWLALAGLAVHLLAACGSDSGKPSASQAQEQAQAQATAAAQRPPQITVQPLSTAVAAGAAATFQVSVAGEGLKYQWERNGEPVPKALGASYTTASASTTDTGTHYRVRIHNDHGEVASHEVTLTVSEAMFSN